MQEENCCSINASNTCLLIPALPFRSLISLAAKKPKSSKYPKTLLTIGDHIRKKLFDSKLLQQDVADRIGVTESTILNWEHNRSTTALRHLPRINAFLTYDPLEVSPITLGDRLINYRKHEGLSRKKLAKQIGIDPTTLSRLERNRGKCQLCILKKASSFFDIRKSSGFTKSDRSYNRFRCDSKSFRIVL
jgi:transcriptional regulator with XRE-family HTH domain